MNFLNIAELTTRAESVPVLADDIEARPTYQCVRCRHSWIEFYGTEKTEVIETTPGRMLIAELLPKAPGVKADLVVGNRGCNGIAAQQSDFVIPA